MKVTFDKIELKATRRWVDPETGKKRQQTRTLMQTVNPFNRLPDGTVKDRATILAELHAARADWLRRSAYQPDGDGDV